MIGSGIAGLVSALLLAARGLEVTVLERAAAPGGKMRQVRVGGASMDAGPTVFTMRWIFDEILGAAGTSLESMLRLQPLGILARHAWGPQTRLDLHADTGRSAEAIGDFAGAAEARRFLEFCAEAKRVYRTLEGPYIRSPRPSLPSMTSALGIRGVGVLAGLGPFQSLWRTLSRHFRDPRLQQLFGRYATYCGSSPFLAPATLVLVAQVEMDGVWAVEGGMHAVAQAFAALAARAGATFRYGTDCTEILERNGRAIGARLGDGSVIEADSVVFNGDVAALAAGRMGPSATRSVAPPDPASRSLSALVWSINGRTHGFPLVRHNVFFDEDYASEFRDIFGHHRLPRRATVYVCAQDRLDDDRPPGDAERLLCLVNAPAIGDRGPLDPKELQRCETASFSLMARHGLTIDRSADNTLLTTPAEFEQLFPATGGGLYGQASHGWMASFRRADSLSRLPGLYLAGGSAHPGPGVPMAAMSGRLAAEALMAHLDSTSRSPRAVTSGGTSTP